MGFLKFLFIAIAVLWLIRVVARLLFPWAMRKAAQKIMGDAAQKQYQQHNSRNRSQEPRPEGNVRIDYMPPRGKTKQGAKSAGEFVEFEEIKSSTK